MGDQSARIVLRTGHPGELPEARISIDYHISGYLTKAMFSPQELISTVTNTLTTFRELLALEFERQRLQDQLDKLG